jgi:hypothetical protein
MSPDIVGKLDGVPTANTPQPQAQAKALSCAANRIKEAPTAARRLAFIIIISLISVQI